MKHWLYGCVFISNSLPRKGYRLADALSCALLRKYSARRSFMVVLLLSRMAFVWHNNFEPSRRAIWRNAKNTTIARPSESCLYSFDKWKTSNDGYTIFRRFVADVRCKTCYSNFWTRMSHIFPMEEPIRIEKTGISVRVDVYGGPMPHFHVWRASVDHHRRGQEIELIRFEFVIRIHATERLRRVST